MIRKNAIVLPLYQLILLFVFFVGFAAILQVPGLTGADIDLSLFKLSVKTFDPWFVGMIGAAGVLTALVPGSMILMTAATLLANNIYRALARTRGRRRSRGWRKLLVPVVALVAVFFTLQGGETIVALLLMGYSFVTQLFPALVLSLHAAQPGDRTWCDRGDPGRGRDCRGNRADAHEHGQAAAVPAGAVAGSEHRHRGARAECADLGGGQCDHDGVFRRRVPHDRTRSRNPRDNGDPGNSCVT